MSSRVSRLLAQSVKGRLYGTQALANQSEKSVAKISKLDNGVTVASIDNDSPISRFAVVFNAGPRFEDSEDLGITHALRRSVTLSTLEGLQPISITRSLQQAGGNLSCTATRENISYCFTGRNGNYEEEGSILHQILTQPIFHPWELNNVKEDMALDLALLEQNHNARLVELLHGAAYSGTLGRSLYAPEYKLGSYSQSQLLSYVYNNYIINRRMAIVGVGVTHEFLEHYGKFFDTSDEFDEYRSTDEVQEKAVYVGGEARQNVGGDYTYVAFANEGVGLRNKDLLTSMVLQMIMGTSPSIKYSDTSNVSKLGQAVHQVTTNPYSVSCLNMNYSDSGLFGFHAQGTPDDIEKIVRTAIHQFASVTKSGLTDQEVLRGKNKLKSAFAMYFESGDGQLENLVEQVFIQEQLYDLSDILQAIDAIKTTDVVNIAKRLVHGTPTMAATGNLEKMPHLNELLK